MIVVINVREVLLYCLNYTVDLTTGAALPRRTVPWSLAVDFLSPWTPELSVYVSSANTHCLEYNRN
jgi:hypothetical protein